MLPLCQQGSWYLLLDITLPTFSLDIDVTKPTQLYRYVLQFNSVGYPDIPTCYLKKCVSAPMYELQKNPVRLRHFGLEKTIVNVIFLESANN